MKELVAQVPDESRMSFAITPAPGERITAGTLGGAIAALEELMSAASNGVPTCTMIDRIETDAAGRHVIHFIVARWEAAKERAARMAAKEKDAKE